MNFLPLLIFPCCLKDKHSSLSHRRRQSKGLEILPLAFIFGRAEKVEGDAVWCLWYVVTGELSALQPRSFLICASLLSAPLGILEKWLLTPSTWRRRAHPGYSGGTFVLKAWIGIRIFLCALMREELRKRDHKRQKEKKVARNSGSGKIKRNPDFVIMCVF